ncbi:MAG TPA: hypothetical protein VIK99_01870 [Thermaerobacter sp.]
MYTFSLHNAFRGWVATTLVLAVTLIAGCTARPGLDPIAAQQKITELDALVVEAAQTALTGADALRHGAATPSEVRTRVEEARERLARARKELQEMRLDPASADKARPVIERAASLELALEGLAKALAEGTGDLKTWLHRIRSLAAGM